MRRHNDIWAKWGKGIENKRNILSWIAKYVELKLKWMHTERMRVSEWEMCSYAIFVPQQQSAHRKLKLEWTEERKTGKKARRTNERTEHHLNKNIEWAWFSFYGKRRWRATYTHTHQHTVKQKRYSGSHLFVDLFDCCFFIVYNSSCHLSGYYVQHWF